MDIAPIADLDATRFTAPVDAPEAVAAPPIPTDDSIGAVDLGSIPGVGADHSDDTNVANLDDSASSSPATSYDSTPVAAPSPADELQSAIVKGANVDGEVNGELKQLSVNNDISGRFANDVVDGTTALTHGDLSDALKLYAHTLLDLLDGVGDLAGIIGFPSAGH